MEKGGRDEGSQITNQTPWGGGDRNNGNSPHASRSGNILTVEGRAPEDLASIRRLGRLTSNGLFLGNRKERLGRAVDLVEPGLRSLEGGGGWNSDRLLPDGSYLPATG